MIAVPDLQRNGRNSNMLHDAQNVASAVQSFESNNQGEVPTTITPASGTATISSTVDTSAATTTATIQKSDTIVVGPASGTFVKYLTTITAANVGPAQIVYDSGMNCNGTTPGQASAAGTVGLTPTADSRSFAVYYPIETSGGGDVGCIQE